MDEDTTAAMAHMAVTLHEQYGFTDACATDGSRIPAPEGAGAGSVHAWPRVAWGVYRGEGLTRGGALLAGSSVQDAEMEAIRSPALSPALLVSTMLFVAFEHAVRRLRSASSGLDTL